MFEEVDQVQRFWVQRFWVQRFWVQRLIKLNELIIFIR